MQADREAAEAELEARLQDACDSATQWKEAAERVAAEKAAAEAALAAAQAAAEAAAQAAEAAAADLRESSAHEAVRTVSCSAHVSASLSMYITLWLLRGM